MPFFNTVVPDDFSNSERLDKYISSLKDGMNRSNPLQQKFLLTEKQPSFQVKLKQEMKFQFNGMKIFQPTLFPKIFLYI